MSEFTCLNCDVKIINADLREHYKSDWHRYNLKRKVAQLPPVTYEKFQKRVLQQRTADENLLPENQTIVYCKLCRKNFSTQNSYDNHLNSKKHKELLSKTNQSNEDVKLVSKKYELKSSKEIEQKMEHDEEDGILMEGDDEIDSDEWEDLENPVTRDNCIFCDHHSEDFMENLKHMSVAHSFFIPDPEFCIDVEGLLYYLGGKICNDYICIWCNDKGRTFFSLDAVRKHMKDKGHCKMLHDGLALAEYADFYDYSSSYPDNEEGMDIDEEIESEPTIEGDEFQLVLPSGAVIGHRSLMRYYKQRLNPNRAVVLKKSDRKLHKVLAEYRSLGWTATQQEAAARKARDLHYMKRQQSKWSMKLGCKANKLQTHFRQQILQ